MDTPYYLAYESRYQKVFEAGIECWGHKAEDEVLLRTLSEWVENNRLAGGRAIDFACGEGACGMILSRLGCKYRGVDIAPSAIEKARARLAGFPDAEADLLDMVRDAPGGMYDAALDAMGYHMLVADRERSAYLKNAFDCLKSGAPMLFFRQSYREDAYAGEVESFAHWRLICGEDYETPKLRHDQNGKEVYIPLVPGRAGNEEGYVREMRAAGFVVEDFVKMDMNRENPYSVSIYVRKP